MTTRVDLGMYDGRPIITSSVVIPGAGGGLHESLAVQPVLLHTGDSIDIVLRCTVEDINHKMIKHKGEDTGHYDRVAKLVPNFGMIIDSADVDKAIAASRKRVEEAAGIQQIPGMPD
jgi:hypothetical protein